MCLKAVLALYIMLAMLTGGCSLMQPAPKPVPAATRAAAGVVVEGLPVGGMTAGEVETVLNTLARQKYVPPQNAAFGDTGQILPERPGQALNLPATLTKVLTAAPGSKLDAEYQTIAPSLGQAKLSSAVKVGSYATPIIDASPGRVENIRLTTKLINNTIIQPGGQFSFNKQTGEPTPERGFHKATVFADDGKVEQGYGGGMCQVSSTLYNAALTAKLTIIERHPHSQIVSYVPAGRDATTADDKDLRLENNSRYPIIIRAFVDGSRVVVDLLSLR